MIARLTGFIVESDIGHIVLDVNGVGYLLFVPLGTAGRVKLEADGRTIFHVHTSVREDAITLFGFADTQQKQVFTKLITINGVGPKLGLAVLSCLTVTELVQAVTDEDLAQLTRVSGVGKKTAQRMMLELPSLLADIVVAPRTSTLPSESGLLGDLRSALYNLGFRPNQVEEVIDKLSPIPEDVNSIEPLLRKALQWL